MDVDENDKSTTEGNTQSGETQTIPDETSSSAPKTTSTNADQDLQKISSNDANERDIKAAAASALGAAAVKAKVNKHLMMLIKIINEPFCSYSSI